MFPAVETRKLTHLCSHVKDHSTNVGKATHNNKKYKDEKHSLQGKHGKTHPVC